MENLVWILLFLLALTVSFKLVAFMFMLFMVCILVGAVKRNDESTDD